MFDQRQMGMNIKPVLKYVKLHFKFLNKGLRQHHCRQCGRAVCDDCSPHRSVLPAVGYEYDVRVCIECHKKLTEADRVPLAVSQETKHSILWIHLDDERGRLLTLGHDRVMKIWDLSFILKSEI